MDKFFELRDLVYKKIKVNKDYRFLNSGHCFDDGTIPFLKHHSILGNIKNRIKFSNGGSFLITGLRGVGKTTVVKQALYELRKDDNVNYMSVFINLSRKIEYTELLFELVRRLYDIVIDSNVIYNIDEKVAQEIILSYRRTSMSITNKNMINVEAAAEGKFKKKYTLNNKITIQSAKDATFLAYSACDVEHDLLRIIQLLNDDNNLNIKLVFVFDELDKLTTSQEGIDYFEKVLSQIKNILCSAEAIFIFIGDIDLFYKWNGDITKINSLYSSIFSWHQYIPCIWDSTEPLLDMIIEKEYINDKIDDKFKYICKKEYTSIIKAPFRAFLIYINFKSKGIPRNIFSEFNHFITWIKDEPYFQFADRDIKVIIAYNQLWNKLDPIFSDRNYETIIEMDLKYVVCFNMIDYLFSHSKKEFTLEDLQLNLLYDNIILKEKLFRIVKELLEEFIENHIIRRIRDDTYVVSDYIIKMEENMIIKDKSLVYNERGTSDINLVNEFNYNVFSDFEKKVKSYNSKAILEFWESFEVKSLMQSNSDMEIYFVEEKLSGKPFIAILYRDKYNLKLKKKIVCTN